MKTLLTFSITLATLLLPSTKHISGTYRVVYKDTYGEQKSYFIDFRDSAFEKRYKDGTKTTGKISKIEIEENRKVVLYLYDSQKNSLKGELDSLLYKSFGVPIMELETSTKDTIPFRTTYSANLRITINEGLLIKEGK